MELVANILPVCNYGRAMRPPSYIKEALAPPRSDGTSRSSEHDLGRAILAQVNEVMEFKEDFQRDQVSAGIAQTSMVWWFSSWLAVNLWSYRMGR